MRVWSRCCWVLALVVGVLFLLDGLAPVGSAEKGDSQTPPPEAPGRATAPAAPSETKPKPPYSSPPANGSKQPSPAAPDVKSKNGVKREASPESDAKKEASPENGVKTQPIPSLPPEIMGRDGATMVLVPAGEFVMGGDDADDDERPVHRVYLDAFYLDKIEVTNARFARFAAAVMSEPPWGFANQDTPVKKSDQPVRWVNWIEATAYCAWVGKRLPTEAEWEKAARGTDGRTFPWGNDPPTPARARFGQMDGAEPSTPNGARDEGGSPYGVLDMAGNLYEWVADWYQEDYYAHTAAKNPRGPAQGSAKSQRGGSFTNAAYRLRSAFRTKGEPTEHHARVGFRCAQDAPAPK